MKTYWTCSAIKNVYFFLKFQRDTFLAKPENEYLICPFYAAPYWHYFRACGVKRAGVNLANLVPPGNLSFQILIKFKSGQQLCGPKKDFSLISIKVFWLFILRPFFKKVAALDVLEGSKIKIRLGIFPKKIFNLEIFIMA